MKWTLTGAVALIGIVYLAADEPKTERYRSPYDVKFSYPIKELIGDLESSPRGDPKDESSVPHREWYSAKVREHYGVWGPPARHYPEPHKIAERPLEWRRERVIAVALRFLGYGYQHHHVPDWDPPAGWPWKEVAAGHNGKGVDCSNFAAFVYNLGFGLKPTGAIKEQAEHLEIAGPGEGRRHRVEKISLPESYEERVRVLHTGDLLYVRNLKGELAHVVIWVGPIGQAPDQTPLVLDSHGEGVKDADGNSIPPGIHLRPFRANSWYNKSASHAHRILHEKE